MAVPAALGPAGLLYLFVPEPPMLYIIEALIISVNILLDQCARKGQKASLVFMLRGEKCSDALRTGLGWVGNQKASTFLCPGGAVMKQQCWLGNLALVIRLCSVWNCLPGW